MEIIPLLIEFVGLPRRGDTGIVTGALVSVSALNSLALRNMEGKQRKVENLLRLRLSLVSCLEIVFSIFIGTGARLDILKSIFAKIFE